MPRRFHVGLTAILVGFTAAQAVAQRDSDPDKARANSVFPTAPSDMRKPLLRAQRAITEGRYSDAAYELGQMLASDSADAAEVQDYFLTAGPPAPGKTETRLKAEAWRMIAEMPREGRDAYELQYGAQARALLDAALNEGRNDKLFEVIRRFRHTRAGHEAAMLAGRAELARGAPMAAALHFQRIMDAPDAAARFDPELSVLLAACWLQARQPDAAQRTLVAMKKRSPQARLRFGDREVDLFRDDGAAVGWLENLVGPSRPVVPSAPIEWVMVRGNPQRNARSRGAPPLVRYRWLVPTAVDREDERSIEKIGKQLRDDGGVPLPIVQPLVVGQSVIMRTPSKIMGVDFQSGKRIWVWPPWDDEEEPAPKSERPARLRVASGDARAVELRQRLWEDAPYGQLSSDGHSVFLLHELDNPATPEMAQQIIFGGGIIAGRFRGNRMPRTANQLVSLSIARQGAAQWIVGGESGEDEPKLAGTFFLGPPLPLDGRLYALGECSGEIRLFVLDAKSGALQWQQQLVHVEERTILIDGVRRLIGATPSYEGGVLVCPTTAGALVAVDLTTRSLLWGYAYRSGPPNPNQPFFPQAHLTPARPTGQRWADATATIADGRVLLPTVDTDELHCVDLLTGKSVWEQPQKREDRLFLACVHEGRAVFVGQSQVSAIQLADGKPAWPKPLAITDLPSGRGVYSGAFYHLPTAGAELLKIDLVQGTIAARAPTATVLGNLLCYQDQVVSQSAAWLSAHFQSEPLRKRVQETLARSPQDPEALARQGELLLQEGKQAEALAALRRVCELNPDDDQTRGLLVETLLASLREDFSRHQTTAADLERLIERPGQRAEYLRIVAKGWQSQGKIKEALDAYLKLAELRDKTVAPAAGAALELERIDRNWNVRADRWLQARIGELLGSLDAAQRAQLDEAIRPHFEAALGGDLGALRRFVAYFGQHPWATAVRQKLAAKLIDQDSLLEAELLLGRLQDAPDEALRRAVAAEQARLLLRSRRMDEAVEAYRRLAERWGDAVCLDGKTGKQLLDAVAADPQFKAARDRLRDWRDGKITSSEGPAEQNIQFANYRRSGTQVRQRHGAAAEGLKVAYDMSGNSLSVFDGWGQRLAQANLGARRVSNVDLSLWQTRIEGHLVVVSTAAEIVVLDLLAPPTQSSEVLRWRHELLRQTNPMTPYHSAVPQGFQAQNLRHPWGGARRVFADGNMRLPGTAGWVSDAGVYFQNGRELVCADPLTGARIWERDNLPLGSDVFGDDEYVFVIGASADSARVFAALDGRDLGERKLERLENRWAVSGRNVLAWSQTQTGEPLVLRLYDAWSGRELWREELPPESKGTLVDADEVAFVKPDGQLTIRSLRDDRVRLTGQLAAGEKKLVSVHVLRSCGQYVVATNRAEPQGGAENIPLGFPYNTIETVLLTGHVQAFDRATGRSLWKTPVPFAQYALPADQPPESPVLLLLRSSNRYIVRQGTARQTQGALFCLDRRNGRTLLEKTDLPPHMPTYEMLADRREQKVALTFVNKTYTFRLTDEPLPPETPPADAPAKAATEAKPEEKKREVPKIMVPDLEAEDPFG